MNQNSVTLVIPGRNAQKTIETCLDSVVPLIGSHGLQEIIFVDDGSTDNTAKLVAKYPVSMIKGKGEGPGAARNLGWRKAKTSLIWFIDADCAVCDNALPILLESLDYNNSINNSAATGAIAGNVKDNIAGVGGSYENMREDSLLACLIHEEIVQRHMEMPDEVNFLATFNVVYTKKILEQVKGFDEKFLKAQDAELAFRIRQAGGILKFDIRSKVKHYHPVEIKNYLNTQRLQGFFRAWLYLKFPNKIAGDSYSKKTDHIQPPLALLSLVFPPAMAPALAALAITQIPITSKIIKRTKNYKFLLFAPLSIVRAYARAIGFSQGTIKSLFSQLKERDSD